MNMFKLNGGGKGASGANKGSAAPAADDAERQLKVEINKAILIETKRIDELKEKHDTLESTVNRLTRSLESRVGKLEKAVAGYTEDTAKLNTPGGRKRYRRKTKKRKTKRKSRRKNKSRRRRRRRKSKRR